MSEINEAITAWIRTQHGEGVHLLAVQPHTSGEQGYPGATLRYYDVDYTLRNVTERAVLVTKEASLVERRTLAWLNRRDLPAPFSHTTDLETDAPVLVYLEYAGDPAPTEGHVQGVARSLAAIHHSALGRGDDLAWLPRADAAFLAERVIDICWRRPWRHLLTGEGYTDWFDRPHQAVASDVGFCAAFADTTTAIEAVAARFPRALTTIGEEAATLTLVHTDLHGEHIRWRGSRARIIDWDQARYGSRYLDLPNLFSREEALLYHDALADLGHTIPRDTFLAGYDAARPYPGFKYFGIGLWNWQHGDPTRRHKNVQYWIDLVLGSGRYGSER